jgi:soluble epoxide hydrolase / lipid-phosphate phosphatase
MAAEPSTTEPATSSPASPLTRHTFTKYDKTLSYLSAGPSTGPLLIFIHGWPGLACTWTSQLLAFAALGFRTIAPDMPGYGASTPKPKTKESYSLQNVVTQLVNLLKHGLEREEAVWIGHDWGAAVVWALVAHHPEICLGVVGMSIPYRTLELGLDELVSYANREIYSEEEFPHAQWSYQAFYESSEENFEKAVAALDKNVKAAMKLFYTRPKEDFEEVKSQPAPTANVSKDGGWFKGADSVPDIPLGSTLLSETLLNDLTASFTEHGFWAPTAYYLNHTANKQWTEDWAVNEGVVSVPVLFIECLHDRVAGTFNTKIMDPMKSYCRKLTTVSISAGHWVALERPEEANAAVARWMAVSLPEGRGWPFGRKNPLRKNE